MIRAIRKLSPAILALSLLFAINASSAQAAPSVTTEKATEVSGTTVRLNATIATEGHETNYGFLYGKSPNISEMEKEGETPIKSVKSASPFEVSAHVSGLEVGTTYYFVVGALDFGEGKYLYGEVRSFKTLAADNGIQFMAEKYPATLIAGSGTLKRVLSIVGGKFGVDCSSQLLLGGELAAAGTLLTVRPLLGSCTSSLGTTEFKRNSCQYEVSPTDYHGYLGPEYENNYGITFSVACTKEGDVIEFKAPAGAEKPCIIKVPPQTPPTVIGGATNGGPVNDRSMSMIAFGQKAKWTTNNASACATVGLPESGEDGSLQWGAQFSAYNGGVKDELFVGGEE